MPSSLTRFVLVVAAGYPGLALLSAAGFTLPYPVSGENGLYLYAIAFIGLVLLQDYRPSRPLPSPVRRPVRPSLQPAAEAFQSPPLHRSANAPARSGTSRSPVALR